jgi:hypothetical protein
LMKLGKGEWTNKDEDLMRNGFLKRDSQKPHLASREDCYSHLSDLRNTSQ